MLFGSPHDLGCDDCPTNLLLIRHHRDLASAGLGLEAVLYGVLFVIVQVRLLLRWRSRPPLVRLQFTPVYVCGLVTFVLVSAAQAGAGDAVWWAAFISMAVLPFAFLGGLLRGHVARLDAELRARLEELRELARGIHPAVLSERGLAPALSALAARAPVPVTVEADGGERLPGPVEIAAYFVVSEALTNVAKYAQATEASVAVRRANGHVTVDVSDDGVGGADAARGSGLRGLADRVAAFDGTLSIDSPAGRGTRLHAEIPCEPLPGPT